MFSTIRSNALLRSGWNVPRRSILQPLTVPDRFITVCDIIKTRNGRERRTFGNVHVVHEQRSD